MHTLLWHVSRVQLVSKYEVVDGRRRGYRRKLAEGKGYAVYRGQPRERARRHGEGNPGIVHLTDDQVDVRGVVEDGVEKGRGGGGVSDVWQAP